VKPLVFLSWGNTVAPVAPLLARDFQLVVPDATLAEQLVSRGFDAVPWTAFGDPARAEAIPAQAAALARDGVQRLAARRFAYRGADRTPAILAAAAGVLERRIAEQLAVADLGRGMAATGRLAAVLVHEDVTPAVRALLSATSRFGVPSLHVPHGVYVAERVVGADVHGTLRADVAAVCGPQQRGWFLSRGVPADRVVVTGNPAWDRVCGRSRDHFPGLGLEPGPVVTVATSWLGHGVADDSFVGLQHARWTQAALDGVARLRAMRGDVRLVLKLHPSAPTGEEERLVRLAVERGAVPDRVLRGDAVPIIAHTDVLVTLPSTIAVEAVLLGTPVIAPEFEYAGDAVRSVPATGDAVADAAAALLWDPDARAAFARARLAFCAAYDGPADGRAGERVAALARDLAMRAAKRRPVVSGPVHVERPDLLARARALAASGRWNDVVAALDETVIASAPAADGAALWTLRGEALSRLGRGGDAEPCFRMALAQGAGASAQAGLGLVLIERGAHGEAEDALTAAAQLDPALDWAWCGLGVLAALRGNADEARRLLAEALRLNPQNPDARSALVALGG
jgi:Flp pilus assembly protein TadD